MIANPFRNVGRAALLSAGALLAGALATGCASQAAHSPAAVTQQSSVAAGAGSAAVATPQENAQPTQAGQLPLPPGPSDPNFSCTDQYNYAGDTRSNAELNSIGVTTGVCPPVQNG